MPSPSQRKKPVDLDKERCSAIHAMDETLLPLRTIKAALADTEVREEVLAVILALRSARTRLAQIDFQRVDFYDHRCFDYRASSRRWRGRPKRQKKTI
jgi:hypothetical protein